MLADRDERLDDGISRKVIYLHLYQIKLAMKSQPIYVAKFPMPRLWRPTDANALANAEQSKHYKLAGIYNWVSEIDDVEADVMAVLATW